jgi:phytoene synthase
MDVETIIHAPDIATLDRYCDRVASAVGRLAVKVFGMQHDAGIALAYHLGRALQLTNILRDIDEDAQLKRVYLPREVLTESGISPTLSATAIAAHPKLPSACAPLVAQARNHFAQASAIMRRTPRATVRAPRIMAAAYRHILAKLIQRGWAAPRAPVKVARIAVAAIVLRYAFL